MDNDDFKTSFTSYRKYSKTENLLNRLKKLLIQTQRENVMLLYNKIAFFLIKIVMFPLAWKLSFLIVNFITVTIVCVICTVAVRT